MADVPMEATLVGKEIILRWVIREQLNHRNDASFATREIRDAIARHIPHILTFLDGYDSPHPFPDMLSRESGIMSF